MTILDEFKLDGKVALALGGNSGIGGAMAQGFAEAGAKVTVVGRKQDKVDSAVARLREIGAEAHGVAADVNDRAALDKLVNDVVAREGRIDVLLNSQGVTRIQPTFDFSVADYRAVMDTNLDSVFWACLIVGRHMRDAGGGSIVNIASLASHRGIQNSVPYTLSKHGVLGLTRGLAAEWAELGIRVNAISPGFFLTDLNRDRMVGERAEKAISRTPFRRFGELEELVGAAVYLASPASGFVTGITIPVDGGFLASTL